jgi:hypothetical protein
MISFIFILSLIIALPYMAKYSLSSLIQLKKEDDLLAFIADPSKLSDKKLTFFLRGFGLPFLYVIAAIIGLAGLYVIGYILLILIIAVFIYGYKTKNKYLSNKFTNHWMSAFDVAKNEWKTLKSYYKKPSNESDSSQN